MRYTAAVLGWRVLRWVVAGLVLMITVPTLVPPPADPDWLVDLTLDLDSPDAVATFMLRRFSFRHDRDLYGVPEYFASPRELLARGAGDCDDWAWFASAALRQRGYPSWLVSVWRSEPDDAGNTGHMIAAYLTADGWGYISTEGNVSARASSIADLAERVSPRWLGASLWTYAGTPRHPVPWNGWQPSIWVPNRALAGEEPPALTAGTRFRLQFEKGLLAPTRLAGYPARLQPRRRTVLR